MSGAADSPLVDQEATSGQQHSGWAQLGFVLQGLLIVGLAVVCLLLGLNFSQQDADTGTIQGAAQVTYYCSMHPQIQSGQPGLCPICGMTLVIMPDVADIPATVPVKTSLAAKLDELQTVRVARGALSNDLELVGKVEVAETRLSTVTAWTAGRLDTLFVNYTGIPVKTGEHMVSLYSPELLTAQTQLSEGIRALAALGDAASERVRQSTRKSLASSRENLRLLGLTEQQIAHIEAGGPRMTNLEIVSPAQGIVSAMHRRAGDWVQLGTVIYEIADLSRVWIHLDVHESQLSWVRVGQTLEIVTEAYDDGAFSGVVTFIYPEVEPKTSSVRIRVEVENKSGRLKPGMFVRARGQSTARAASGDSLVVIVPGTAVLYTGTRHVAFVVRDARQGPGTEFFGRTVRLGRRAGDAVEVVSGLEEGELVVRYANFRIDSAVAVEAHAQLSGRALRAQLEPVYGAYFELVRALAADDPEAAREAFGNVSAALIHFPHAEVPEAGRRLWQDLSEPLREFVAETEDVAALRNSLFRLSALLGPVLDTFGRETGGVWLMECPMARRFRSGEVPELVGLPAPTVEGAHWFQDHAELKNPYFGAMMLDCGTILGRFPSYIPTAEHTEEPDPGPASPQQTDHSPHDHGEEMR